MQQQVPYPAPAGEAPGGLQQGAGPGTAPPAAPAPAQGPGQGGWADGLAAQEQQQQQQPVGQAAQPAQAGEEVAELQGLQEEGKGGAQPVISSGAPGPKAQGFFAGEPAPAGAPVGALAGAGQGAQEGRAAAGASTVLEDVVEDLEETGAAPAPSAAAAVASPQPTRPGAAGGWTSQPAGGGGDGGDQAPGGPGQAAGAAQGSLPEQSAVTSVRSSAEGQPLGQVLMEGRRSSSKPPLLGSEDRGQAGAGASGLLDVPFEHEADELLSQLRKSPSKPPSVPLPPTSAAWQQQQHALEASAVAGAPATGTAGAEGASEYVRWSSDTKRQTSAELVLKRGSRIMDEGIEEGDQEGGDRITYEPAW